MPSETPRQHIEQVTEVITELTRRALVQAGDMREIEDRLRAIAERAAKNTRSSMDRGDPPAPPEDNRAV